MRPLPTGNRRTVLERSRGLCERCGRWLANIASDIHHRKPRRMGGTSDPNIHDLANLVVVCRGCHDHIETNRAQAIDQGWLISQHDRRDPSEIPVFLMGDWYLLPGWDYIDLNPPF